MQYALLIYEKPGATDAFSDDQRRAITGEYLALGNDPRVTSGAKLTPIETATTVRVRDGQMLITDGPFADTREVLGGFYLFEADDLDAALEVAARIPAARLGGAIEVRPLVER
jgi:hypothetical protein